MPGQGAVEQVVPDLGIPTMKMGMGRPLAAGKMLGGNLSKLAIRRSTSFSVACGSYIQFAHCAAAAF